MASSSLLTPFEKAERDWRIFHEKWWEQFGTPVTGEGLRSDDPQWLELGLKVLHANTSVIVCKFLVMVFDEDPDRARRGLDSMRSHYKKTHPELALLWGRGRPGRQSSLNNKQCIGIGLATEFGIGKVRILRVAGLVDENFDSGSDRSKYALIDRASNEGRRSPRFVTERNRLQALSPAERERQILKMLKPTSKRL